MGETSARRGDLLVFERVSTSTYVGGGTDRRVSLHVGGVEHARKGGAVRVLVDLQSGSRYDVERDRVSLTGARWIMPAALFDVAAVQAAADAAGWQGYPDLETARAALAPCKVGAVPEPADVEPEPAETQPTEAVSVEPAERVQRAPIGCGYSFSIDGREYDGWRDGRPFTLPDAWRQVEGVRGATIYAPSGRVILTDAGSMSARCAYVTRCRRKADRIAANLAAMARSREPVGCERGSVSAGTVAGLLCVLVLILAGWALLTRTGSGWPGDRADAAPAATVQACRVVVPHVDDRDGDEIPQGSDYSGSEHGGVWTDPAGAVIGYAAQEDDTVWNLPECMHRATVPASAGRLVCWQEIDRGGSVGIYGSTAGTIPAGPYVIGATDCPTAGRVTAADVATARAASTAGADRAGWRVLVLIGAAGLLCAACVVLVNARRGSRRLARAAEIAPTWPDADEWQPVGGWTLPD